MEIATVEIFQRWLRTSAMWVMWPVVVRIPLRFPKMARTVWSFGGGDNGKLGHGDTNRVYKPKLVEALQGMFIRKICAGSQSSLALTSTGQLYAWGCGACLGCGSSEATALRPKLIEELACIRMVDISSGDSHCLALTHDNEVYAWGNNSMGQCGQSHATSPVTKPKKVMGLDGVAIQQISAGTSHSLSWTALPTDRQVVAWHRPFCVDLEESTFCHIRSFLEHYYDRINSDTPPAPFPTSREHHHFVLLCLKLLSTHLSLAMAGGVATSILGNQARPLRNLLFRLMDSSVPETIQEAVTETLSVGASMLLPPLKERMELLHSLLPQGPDRWESLSKGQRMQLDIILTSLQDHVHVASLLGYTRLGEDGESVEISHSGLQSTHPDTHLAEVLMKTLLRNMGFYTERAFGELEKNSDKQHAELSVWSSSPPAHLHDLLSSLHKHLLAFCHVNTEEESCSSVALLHKHLQLLLPHATDIFTRSSSLLRESAQNDTVKDKLQSILYGSAAGSMLCQIVNSLLLLAMPVVRPLLCHLIEMLPSLDCLNRLLPAASHLEKQELEWPLNGGADCTESQGIPLPVSVNSWVWLVDLERALSLLIGRCLGAMLQGPRCSPQEHECSYWLGRPLFSHGLETSVAHFEECMGSLEAALNGNEEHKLFEHHLSDQKTLLVDLALGSSKEPAYSLWVKLQDYALSRDWDSCNLKKEPLLDTVSRFVLAALLKHSGLLMEACKDGFQPSRKLAEVYLTVYKLRNRLLAQRNLEFIGARANLSKRSRLVSYNSDGPDEFMEGPTECSPDEGMNLEPRRGKGRGRLAVAERRERGRLRDTLLHEHQDEEGEDDLTPGKVFQCFLTTRSRNFDSERPGVEDVVDLESRDDLPDALREVQVPESAVLTKRASCSPDSEEIDLFTASCQSVIHRCALLIFAIASSNQEIQSEANTEDQEGQSLPNQLSENEESIEMHMNVSPWLGRTERDFDLPGKDFIQDKSVWMENSLGGINSPRRLELHTQDGVEAKSYQNIYRERNLGSRAPHTILLGDLLSLLSDELVHLAGKEPEGSFSDPRMLALAMEQQQARAELRVEALHQILTIIAGMEAKEGEEHLGLGSSPGSPMVRAVALLTSVRLQFLAGCFGLGVISSPGQDSHSLQLHHYQDSIASARFDTRKEIQMLVHRIYQHLSSMLENGLQANKHHIGAQQRLLLVTVFVLSVRYQPADVALAVSSSLLGVLSELCGSDLSLGHPWLFLRKQGFSRLGMALKVASTRLLQILAITTGMYADRLSSTVVQALIDLLCGQLKNLLAQAQGSALDHNIAIPKWIPEYKAEMDAKSAEVGMHPIGISAEIQLGDFLVFLRRVVSSKGIQSRIASPKWMEVLLNIAAQRRPSGVPLVGNLRTRLLALHILEAILPACDSSIDSEQMHQVIGRLLILLADSVWELPFCLLKNTALAETEEELNLLHRPLKACGEDANLPIQEVSFDPEKTMYCTVEGGTMLAHGSGGKGYGLASTSISSGAYQWKFLILKENRGNEGTCVGLSRWPVRDFNHRTTSDMWLYRAYSGNLYHNGEHTLTLNSFTQGDNITCVLDTEARTISFGKNGEDPRLAFEDVDAADLYPCVMFYSSNPGEKVKICDMQMRGAPRDLLPGEPMCSPGAMVLAEATVQLVRVLHCAERWDTVVGHLLLERLQGIRRCLSLSPKIHKCWSAPPGVLEVGDCDSESNEGRASHLTAVELTEVQLRALCLEVWPALAVMGGVDQGLRVGGRCIHKLTGRHATVLGVLKDGSTSAKVQWDDTEVTISDTPLSNLEPCEPLPFDAGRLPIIPASVLLDLTHLTGIHEELGMTGGRMGSKAWRQERRAFRGLESQERCEQQFKPDEEGARSPSLDDVPLADAEEKQQESKSEVLGGVQHPGTAQQNGSARKKIHDGMGRIHEAEMRAVQASYISVSAMKTLSMVLGCSRYAELLLVPRTSSSEGSNHNADREGPTWPHEETELRTALQALMHCVVKRAVSRSPIKWSASLTEMERAQSIVHKLAVAGLLGERLGWNFRHESLTEDTRTSSQVQTPVTTSPSDSSSTSLMSSSLEDTTTATTPVTDNETAIVPDSPGPGGPLPYIRNTPFQSYQLSLGPLHPSRRAQTPPPLSPATVASQPTSPLEDTYRRQSLTTTEPQHCRQATRTASSDPTSRQSFSPPPPPVAAPLLEMGFPLRHIQRALEATGTRGDADLHSVTLLATWMLEHPYMDDDEVVPSASSAPISSEPLSTTSPPKTWGEMMDPVPSLATSEVAELEEGYSESPFDQVGRGSLLGIPLTRVRPPPARRHRLNLAARTILARAGMYRSTHGQQTDSVGNNNGAGQGTGNCGVEAEAGGGSGSTVERGEAAGVSNDTSATQRGDPRALYDMIVDEELDLSLDEETIEDMFGQELASESELLGMWFPEVLDWPTWHVREMDEPEEVVCELCDTATRNFNQHMRHHHPGCGGSSERQGYRSNGSYVDGWFGGDCGTGNPYYLLCSRCRTKYLALKNKCLPSVTSSKGRVMDLISKQESVYEDDWDLLDICEDVQLTGQEDFDLLAAHLGLSEKRLVPPPVQFPDSDPLGASVAMVTATSSMEETLMQIGIIGSGEKSSSNRMALGEQAASIHDPHDRILALKRVSAAALILLSRTIAHASAIAAFCQWLSLQPCSRPRSLGPNGHPHISETHVLGSSWTHGTYDEWE
uniref:HECT and RLD domain containing E3 ubiquitin protein ligase family member 1 n=1 Tax=Eptatretus burgeri TaxID=7764 RepID=A0A8C4Q7E9_EPTBU